jgi:hypothetical protein
MDQEESIPGDEISTGSGLQNELQRSEGQPSWDDIEQEPVEDSGSEIEASVDSTSNTDNQKEEIESEESEQKNTLGKVSRRVLPFSQYFTS